MDNNKWTRGAAVFGSNYIKRWLEGKYDQLAELPAVSKLRSLSKSSRLGIEAILYTLAAYAEQKLSDQSPLGLMAKSVLMDAAPEISSRLIKDARADLEVTCADAGGPSEPRQNVARKLLGMESKELLGVLIAMDEMDDGERSRFLEFAAQADAAELAKFAALDQHQREIILNTQGPRGGSVGAGWGAALKSFTKDFWVVFSAWAKKSHDVALPVLARYMSALLWVLKSCAIYWVMAFVACTAAAMCSQWVLFAVLLLISIGAGFGLQWGRRNRVSWAVVGGAGTCVVMVMLALLTAAGYPDAVFGVAVLLLAGVPTLVIAGMLLPVTVLLEILRSLFPSAYHTLMRAAQMLLSAILGILLIAVVLLLFPPQNPVAFIIVVPAAMLIAFAASVGLTRARPDVFLKPSVVISLGFMFLVAVGVMSMPNLRAKLRALPGSVDRALLDGPVEVQFESSGEIDFMTADGDVRIWYAEKPASGYNLFRCEGVGPYYTKDGRKLSKADSAGIRSKIANWVDSVAEKKAEAARKAEVARMELESLEQERLQELKRQRAEEVARQRREAAEKAEKSRLESYLVTKSLPARADYLICLKGVGGKPANEYSSAMVRQIKSRGKSSSATVFSEKFITSQAFDRFFSGEGKRDTERMPLAGMGARLLLVRFDELKSKNSDSIAGLVTANMKVSIRVLDAADARVLQEFHFTAVGPGASAQDAINAAFARILGQFEGQELK